MEILLPRMRYTHEIVGTHGEALLPERARGMLQEQNPSCVSALKDRGVYSHNSSKINKISFGENVSSVYK